MRPYSQLQSFLIGGSGRERRGGSGGQSGRERQGGGSGGRRAGGSGRAGGREVGGAAPSRPGGGVPGGGGEWPHFNGAGILSYQTEGVPAEKETEP